jgi:hypothetical protein
LSIKTWKRQRDQERVLKLTFIFADVFECKCQTRVFAFNNANLAEGSLSNHSEETEVVKIHWTASEYDEHQERTRLGALPSSVKTTGLPWEFPIRSFPD